MVDLQALQDTFRERYGTEPRLFSAPGRANLIGEHTDYNAGFVLPIAANLRTYVAAGARGDYSFRVYSCNLQDEVKFQLGPLETKQRGWFNYVYGVSQVLKDAGHELKGADVVIASEVPRGAGQPDPRVGIRRGAHCARAIAAFERACGERRVSWSDRVVPLRPAGDPARGDRRHVSHSETNFGVHNGTHLACAQV